jgi:hypothetical protein
MFSFVMAGLDPATHPRRVGAEEELLAHKLA